MVLSCDQVTTKSPMFIIHSDQIIGTDFIGNGVQWSAYPHADSPEAEWGELMNQAKWDTVMTRLDIQRPPFIRVMDQAAWRYFKGYNKDGTPILDFDTQEIKSLFKILDYCQKRNITVVFGEWGAPDYDTKPKPSNHIKGANDPRWINMIGEYLSFIIIEKRYTCIKYYNLVNEPNGNWASTNGNYEEWKEGVVMLQAELVRRGLDQFISISGPGTVPDYDNPITEYHDWMWTINSIEDIDSILSIYEVHAYLSTEAVRDGKAAESIFLDSIMDAVNTSGKQFFLGELGMKEPWGSKKYKENIRRVNSDPCAGPDSNMRVYDFDYGVDMVDAAIQMMNFGVDGMMAWDVDDAMHTSGDTGDTSKLKRWGFWNILGSEICGNSKDESIRPWFYSWSLMSKYFPKGSTILKSSSYDIPYGVRLAAGMQDEDYTIALVNNSDSIRSVSWSMPNVSGDRIVHQYRFEEIKGQDSYNKVETIEIDFERGCQLELIPKSVVLITTMLLR